MIEFPDVSNHNPGVVLNGAAACIAKATEGATFRDALYADFRWQASTLDIPFAAYHWINEADLSEQAHNAFFVVQRETPLMIDAEAPGATVERIVSFVDLYRSLGGRVTMVYFPHWWWQELGEPSLMPFAETGLALVSSNYTPGANGFAPYGGITPQIWQFTNAMPFNGESLDFNRYNGSVAELAALFNGGVPMSLSPDEATMLYNTAQIVYEALVPAHDTMGARLFINGQPVDGAPISLVRKLNDIEAKLDQLLAGQPVAGVAAHTHTGGTTGPVTG